LIQTEPGTLEFVDKAIEMSGAAWFVAWVSKAWTKQGCTLELLMLKTLSGCRP